MRRTPILILIFFCISASLFAQETKTIFDERMQILNWGIDSQILELLPVLSGEKDPSYNEVLFQTLLDTRNPEIQEKIIYYLMDMKYAPLTGFTREYCRFPLEDRDYNNGVLFASIASLGHLKDTTGATILYDLAFLEITGISGPVTRSLASLGDDSGADRFLKRLEELDLTDKQDSMSGEIILFLGEIRYQPAASFLMGIVESEENYSMNRNYACFALGQIGNPEAIEVLKTIYYGSKDSILRSYALAGLGYFNTPETGTILVDALKRDSFWKVRVSAAEKIGDQKIESAIDLLIYKAGNDPVDQVRVASMKALGKLGLPQGFQYLSEFYTDIKKTDTLRFEAFKILLHAKSDLLLVSMNTVFEKEWESKTSRIFEFTCRELSTTEWPEVSELYKRMLLHSNPSIRIYGIRGIRRNNLVFIYPEAKALDREGESGLVRKEAALIP
jgi:HEAT repeat protein